MQHDGKYWMAYTAVELGAVDGIGLASSVDLIHWSDEAGNPIIAQTDPEAEDWEKKDLITCDFLYMGDEVGHANDFWIFYRAADVGVTHTAVGVVKSNDMTTWARDTARNPIVNWTPGWVANAIGCEDFSVQKTSTGDWMAIYEADTEPTAGATNGVASCAQTLPHSGWADEGQVCSGTFGGDFIANPVGIRRTIDGVSYYYSYYEWSGAGVIKIYGMYAEESDIFTTDAWTQLANPVLTPTETWEDDIEIPNGLVWANNRFYCYYVGNIGVDKKIGLALGPDGALGPLEKYADNIVDYQMKITVNYGAGADSGTNVYLNEKCRTDFGDIRFTYQGSELSAWIQEKVDSDNAVFWVKIPFIFPSPETATIYIHYGKGDATTNESGADTWFEFENWEAYAVDAVLPLGLFEASTIEEICKVDDNRAFKGAKSLWVDDDSAVNSNFMTWNFADKEAGGFRFILALYLETDYGADVSAAFHFHRSEENGISIRVDGDGDIEDYYPAVAGDWHDTGADLTADSWHVLEICAVIGASTWDFRFDGTWYLNRPKRFDLDKFIYSRIFLGGIAGMIRGNLGVCAIGKYMDPEPSHGAWGGEESVAWTF